MLAFQNITKTFGKKVILDNVTFGVEAGHMAILLGQSGVGKSTLLRILNNLETLDAGTIMLDNKPLDLAQVNHTHVVGMIFQQFNLFEHVSVQENITLALTKVLKKTPQQAYSIATQLLTHYGLADKAQMAVKDLSGGQKQRLAIARALAVKPRIICADEPTSALDPLLSNHVAKNFQDLAAQGYIILIATHDVTLLTMLHATVHLMQQGKIIETATTQELYKAPEKFPQLHAFIAGTHSL